MAKVAFIGLGVMGYPMAAHLKNRGGHDVTVYNRTTAKAEKWVGEHGGAFAATPAEAARGKDFVFACVGNDDDLRSVTLGADGAFEAMQAGAIFIDNTTASAEIARELDAEAARMIAAALALDLADAKVYAQAGVKGGVELLCGFNRDVEMGDYLVLAAGAIYTEPLNDSVVVLFEPAQDLSQRITSALDTLRIGPLLRGVRGRDAGDVDATVKAIAAAAQCFAAETTWRAMEINPLTVSEHGAVVVDARALVN